METSVCSITVSKVQAFKSYYVVWKLRNISKLFLKEVSFKSYYVVWKLVAKEIFAFRPGSLNRTM